MTKKKSAGAGELRNSAMVLHDFLTGLQAAGVQNQSQFDAINQVLALGSPGKASFHRHMAELHRLY